MKPQEKKLYEKLLANYHSKNRSNFTPEENKLISALIVHKKVNKDAFIDVTGVNSYHQEFIQSVEYPLTILGEEEKNKNWYLKFRDSNSVIVIRDILTVIAFLLSLWLTINNILQQ